MRYIMARTFRFSLALVFWCTAFAGAQTPHIVTFQVDQLHNRPLKKIDRPVAEYRQWRIEIPNTGPDSVAGLELRFDGSMPYITVETNFSGYWMGTVVKENDTWRAATNSTLFPPGYVFVLRLRDETTDPVPTIVSARWLKNTQYDYVGDPFAVSIGGEPLPVYVTPNAGNIAEYLLNTMVSKTGIVIGKPHTGKKGVWVRLTKFNEKMFPGTGKIDRLAKSGKGEKKNNAALIKGNYLAQQLFALKLTALVQQSSVVEGSPADPVQYADFVFNYPNPIDYYVPGADSAAHHVSAFTLLNGKTIGQIINLVDSVLTFGAATREDYYQLSLGVDWILHGFNSEYIAIGMKPMRLSAFNVGYYADEFLSPGTPAVAPGSRPGDAPSGVEVLPGRFALFQNFPNPFNPETEISFSLPEASRVTLRIFNILGQEVALLADNEAMATGEHRILFNAASLSSGLYLYRLSAGSMEETGTIFEQTRRMILTK